MGTKPQKSKKPLVFKGFLVVPEEGLEPSRTCVRQILSLLRLPLRHSGPKRERRKYTKTFRPAQRESARNAVRRLERKV